MMLAQFQGSTSWKCECGYLTHVASRNTKTIDCATLRAIDLGSELRAGTD